jgi:dTDP-4-amino-4,6-dideoxy-D-glucose acyltransferase
MCLAYPDMGMVGLLWSMVADKIRIIRILIMFDNTKLKTCGEDVFIDDCVRITRPHLVNIGNHVGIDFGCYCSVGMNLADYVHISPHVSIVGGGGGLLEMAEFTTIACGSRLICNGEAFSGEGLVGPIIPKPLQDRHVNGPIRLERFAGIASNVVVFPGVVLREGSVVGAGSVLTHSTEPWTVYIGAPARAHKQRRRDIMPAFAEKMGYRLR